MPGVLIWKVWWEADSDNNANKLWLSKYGTLVRKIITIHTSITQGKLADPPPPPKSSLLLFSFAVSITQKAHKSTCPELLDKVGHLGGKFLDW